MPHPAVVGLPRVETLSRFAECSLLFGIYDGGCYRRCDGDGDFVLDGENVGHVTVKARGPDMGACRCVDQLPSYANAIANTADAALQHIAHTEFSADIANINDFAAKSEAGVAGNDE